MAQDRFFDHPRSEVKTSQGTVEVPVLYRDASSVLAYFRVDHARASELLAATPFAPIRFGTGFAMAGLAFFDYRESTVGPYCECALAVAALPRGLKPPIVPMLQLLRPVAHREIGYYVLDLPVTTSISDVAGRELWGLPKFVTSIDVEVGPRHIRGAVQAPAGGEPIVTLEGSPGRGFAFPALDLVVFSVARGEALRTVVNVRGRTHTALGGGLTVRLGGSSSMREHLAALGLDGVHPSMVQACDHAQMVLHAGEPLVQRRAA